jgi:hypothetical protein
MAAALCTLATRLHANIFKPYYIPESLADCRTIKKILDDQFKVDIRDGEINTCALLSPCPEKQVKMAINLAVHTALEDILKHLGLFLNGRDDAFCTELEALLYRAADMWTETQHNKKAIEVNVEDGDFPEWQWEYLKEFSELTGTQSSTC